MRRETALGDENAKLKVENLNKQSMLAMQEEQGAKVRGRREGRRGWGKRRGREGWRIGGREGWRIGGREGGMVDRREGWRIGGREGIERWGS